MRRRTFSAQFPRAPVLRQGWTVTHVTLVQIAALVLPVGASMGHRGPVVLTLLIVAAATALLWEIGFDRLRRRAVTGYGLTTAMIVAVLAPDAAAPWQIALSVSFGVVIGELVFGGRGFGFLNAALASLAFLVFSFPALGLASGVPAVALATLPGAAALVFSGLISWRLLVAVLAGAAAFAVSASPQLDASASLAVLAFPAVFMIADPVGGSVTNLGRIGYGALIGALAVSFSGAGASELTTEAVVFAALVGGVFAPLLDDGATRWAIYRRARRHE